MNETKECPYCGKEILSVAKKCKYCGTWIEQRKEFRCPVCCEIIPEDSEVCPYCHEKLNGTTAETSRPIVESIRDAGSLNGKKRANNDSEVDNGKSHKKIGKVFWIIVAVIAILAIAFATWYIYESKQKRKAEEARNLVEQNKQREWILSEIPERVWYTKAYETLNAEYRRLLDVFDTYENEEIEKYRKNRDLDNKFVDFLFEDFSPVIDELYKRRTDSVINIYQEHCQTITKNMANTLGICLSLRDSGLYVVSVPKDKELFLSLMGTPDNLSKIPDTQQYAIARTVAINRFKNLVKPSISTANYNKERELWHIIMENAENQYAKFYLREDGYYNVLFSNELDGLGNPESDEAIVTPFRRSELTTNKKTVKDRTAKKMRKHGLSSRVLELCNYIPDHGLDPNAKDYMTDDFYSALAEAFDAPRVPFGTLDNEWLYYFVTGNGGAEPYYTVKELEKIDKNHTIAVIRVQEVWEEDGEPQGEGILHKMSLVCSDGKWLMDDFDNKKKACVDYVQFLREKCESGEIMKTMESDKSLRDYIPEFQSDLNNFYKKHGRYDKQFVFETDKFTIRVGKLGDNYYYNSWNKGKTIKDKPSLVISNGTFYQADDRFVFYGDGGYVYYVGREKAVDNSTDYYVEVNQKGKVLVKECVKETDAGYQKYASSNDMWN